MQHVWVIESDRGVAVSVLTLVGYHYQIFFFNTPHGGDTRNYETRDSAPRAVALATQSQNR